MKYELELLLSNCLYIFYSLYRKKIDIDVLTITLISRVGYIILISLKNIYNYNYDKDKTKVLPNNLGLTNNMISNIFQPESLFLGFIGIVSSLLNLYVLKKLPANFVLPLGLLWMIFALFFNKYLRDVDIKQDDVISLGIVIVGLLIMQYQKIFEELKFETSYLLPIILLIIAQIINAYCIISLKKYEDLTSADQVQLINFSGQTITIVIIYLIFLFYPSKFLNIKKNDTSEIIKFLLLVITIGYTGLTLNYTALKNLSENRYTLISSSYVILIVLLSWLFLGESISIYHIIGSIIIIFGLTYKNIEHRYHNKMKHLE